MRRDLVVPKGKCPLDVLAEQGEEIRNTWIFLHESVVLNLKDSEGVDISRIGNDGIGLIWKATEKYQGNGIIYRYFECLSGWYILDFVLAKNIAYTSIRCVQEPEDVIFVKMEEQ